MIFIAPGFELMGSTTVVVTVGVLDAAGLAEATGSPAHVKAGNTTAACINRTAARIRSSEGWQSSRLNRRCTEVCQRIARRVSQVQSCRVF